MGARLRGTMSPEAVWFVLAMLAIAGFFAFRWVLLWYWRVNEAVDLLKEIRDSLRPAQAALPTGAGGPASATSPVQTPTPSEATIRFAPKPKN